MDYTDLLGIKYKIHGRTKEEGFDCYGLAIEVLRRNEINLIDVFYRDLNNISEIKKSVIESIAHKTLVNPKKNCIIELSVLGEPCHIAVYIGNGYIIHATRNRGVIIEPLHRYSTRIRGIYKV